MTIHAPARNGVTADVNPFRMQVLESIPYEAVGESNDAMWARVETLSWYGAIVGPHGSGKTTLLEAARERLEAKGLWVIQQRINRQSAAWERRAIVGSIEKALRQRDSTHASRGVILFDGYGHLSWAQRNRLRRLAHGCSVGLLVAAHRSTRLPTWVQTDTNEQRMAWLLDRVAERAGVSIEVDVAQSRRAYRAANGNLRLAMRSLFDEAMEGRLVVRP